MRFKLRKTDSSKLYKVPETPLTVLLFGIGLFWVGFILLDGDLYLCLLTKPNDTQRELPCKKNLTLQEMSIITIHKNWSQLYGYISIAVGFFGWWLISNTKVGIYCDRCSCQCLKDCCDKIYERKPYYERRGDSD
ncbi:unnamed protein product [Leuciscus chuanchicus]